MKHSLPELLARITEAGVRDPADGFPLRATMAAIAQAEGADPNAWTEHDPPTSATSPPSSGLFQVHLAAWPTIYAETERVRHAPLGDRDKILAMTAMVKPIIADAFAAAVAAEARLESRGIEPTPLRRALMMDAVWQAGAPHLAHWARTTRTGDAREIVNPQRTIDVEVALRSLAPGALEITAGAGLLLGVLAAFGLAAFALSRWKT